MSMQILIDTNIFLDVLLAREPFWEASRQILTLCEERKIQGFLSASAVTDLYYIIRRQLHSTERAYTALGFILDIAGVLPVTGEDVLQAYLLHAADFEDGLAATCAAANHCDRIITRNTRDFADFAVRACTPEEFLRERASS